MCKNFNLRRAGGADGLRVLPGALPGQHHPLTAVGGDLIGAAGGKDAHLGAGVEREIRQSLPQQVQKAPVLNQDRVHAQAAGFPGGFQGAGQLPVRQKGVEGQKDPHAPQVAVGQGVGKFLIRKVPGVSPGVEVSPA